MGLDTTCYGNINPTSDSLAQDLGLRADVEILVR